ncbi:MAG TPA: SDR family NAD(P)-dependent oxidoreductase [Chloroflexota bacterium]|nr:SDR family NAD(P)-dependent oxidoreductase [Chloroflexota bacterium]
MDLEGQLAVVTGGAKLEGIGHAVALGLAGEGADIVIGDIYEQGFPEATRAIEALGRRCTCVRTNVLHQPDVERLIETAGRVDVLVNAAGGSWAITPEDITGGPPQDRFIGLTTCTLDEWRTIVGVNLEAVFYACRAAAPHMMRQRRGRIVNFSSTAGRRGVSPGGGSSGPYAVAKAGVIGLTKQLALELAPYGVTVNAVAPGVIMSWRGKRLWEASSEERRRRMIESVPMGRPGTVDEVAGLVVALCTPEMGYVTGATLDVNGAMYSA